MPKRIAQSTLNASTIDIINVIRQNASPEYQAKVPTVTKAQDIPKVGEVIYGTPGFANQFINALVNRIAMTKIQSAVFNNPYSNLKKGMLEFGETIEDIFISIANVYDYSAEKGSAREFKRYLPDVKSAFHTMNWRVMYPITVQNNDLKLAFLSIDGVTDLIGKIVEQVYTASEYDEFLLFKYLMIKAIAHGKMFPKSIGAGTNINDSAVAFRGTSNLLPFMSNKYNEFGVKTTTPKNKQIIFMDAEFNAQFDVNVLASAFNMDKADFMGRLYLIDNWTEFDNERFDYIRSQSDNIEEITNEELALLEDVKAVIVDEDWFQVYDNLAQMEDTKVSSGLYWNYFYHTWKTISYSPFANAIAFLVDSAQITAPETISVEITGKDVADVATVFTLAVVEDDPSVAYNNPLFVQTEALVESGIAVQKFGALIIPSDKTSETITLVATMGGATYTASTTIDSTADVGDTITLTKNV